MIQQQPQLEQVVNMLDSAKDLLDQHKPQAVGKTFPNISMQTEIRWVDSFFSFTAVLSGNQWPLSS